MTPVMDVRAARWIWSLVVCGLASVAVHIFGMTLAPAALAEDRGTDAPGLREVVAAVPRSWPPQYDVDEDGNPIGFAIDVMDEIAALAGLHVTYYITDGITEAGKAVRDGRADIIPNNGIIPERQAQYGFTAPVETFAVSIFVRGDTFDIKGMPDLVGRRVAVVRRNVGHRRLKHRKDMDIAVFRDVPTALFELVAGQVDAFIYPQPVVLRLARQIGIEDRIKVVGEPFVEVKRGISVHKDNTELLAVLDKAVERFVGTPAYERIYVKWYGSPRPFWTVRLVVWAMGGCVVMVLLAMAGWRYHTVVNLNRALQRTVAERKRAEAALRESEERLRLVTDALPVLISYVGKDGRYRFVNKAYEDWFGIPCEQVRGMHVRELVGDEAYQGLHERIEDVLSGQSVQYEAKLPFQHGGDRHIQGVYVPHFAENGGVDGFFALITDVTEQKKAEAQLIRASRLATLGEMASGIAHELNQPLTNMRMMAENALVYVESADVDAAVQTRKLEGVIGQVDRMAGIVDHMRLFSRKDSAEKETFSPTACAADAVGMVENQYRALGVRLNKDFAAECGHVSGHRFKLEQVILNLLSNARDAAAARADRAAREGREFVPEVSVGVAEDRKTGTVILSVTDNGGGVPEDVLDEIFDPFFTTKAEGQGTGLGLSISYSIIDTMGGRIEVRNAEDGARFDVILPVADEILPVADEAHPRLPAPKPQEQPVAADRRGRLVRVLVVDDEEPTATNTAEYLEYAGYATATAGNGAEALELFTSDPFDVVVTDRRMPVMDGNQLIRRLRALDPDLPIIAMTGQDASDDGQTAPAAGNDGAAAGGASVVLRKPIRLSDLEGHVRRLTQA